MAKSNTGEGRTEEHTKVQTVYTDSGANTTVLGANWYVISESMNRTITVYGFHDNLKKANMPLVRAVAKIYIDNVPILRQVNEGAYLGEGHSCLSSVHVGANGFFVDDNVYFGEGKIHTKEEWGFDIPLEIESGLAFFQIEMPTEKDLENLECYELTSDYPWDPTNVEETNWVNIKKGRADHEKTFIDELSKRIGNSNLDRVKRTLDVTTWMGSLDPRRPLRKHFKPRLLQMGLI